MPLQKTNSLTSAEAKSIILLHGDSLYTTISCTNAMDLRQEVISEGNIVISQPPASTTAYMRSFYLYHRQYLTLLTAHNFAKIKFSLSFMDSQISLI